MRVELGLLHALSLGLQATMALRSVKKPSQKGSYKAVTTMKLQKNMNILHQPKPDPTH